MANDLIGRRRGQGSGSGVSTDIEAYCAQMNDREWRRGEWSLIGEKPNRELSWKAEVASDAWLLANGLPLPRCPSDEKRAILAECIREERRREAERDQQRMTRRTA